MTDTTKKMQSRLSAPTNNSTQNILVTQGTLVVQPSMIRTMSHDYATHPFLIARDSLQMHLDQHSWLCTT